MTTALLNKDQVKNLIPHREPILLVDEIVSYEKYDVLHARRTFPKGDSVFEGHFPGHPVMPGVLGVEALAQASACLVNLSIEKCAEETIFYFMAIDDVKFRLPVLPDTVLDLHVTMVKNRGGVFKFQAKAMIGDKLATQANFTAKVQEVTKANGV